MRTCFEPNWSDNIPPKILPNIPISPEIPSIEPIRLIDMFLTSYKYIDKNGKATENPNAMIKRAKAKLKISLFKIIQ